MDNDNIALGYSFDPSIVYGPATSRLLVDRKQSEDHVVTDAPLDGPSPSGAETVVSSRVTPGTFVKSPVGLLVMLLVPAYILFHHLFGMR